MEVTLFGVIWFFLLLVGFFRPISWMVFLLILSGVFQATAVINLTDKGFSPFLFSQICFILRNAISILNTNEKIVRPDKGFIYLVSFLLLSALGAITLPVLFKGMKIYSPELGIDLNYLTGGTSLSFKGGNLVQCFYLLLDVTCLYQLYKLRSRFLFRIAMNSFIFSIFVVLIIGFWEFASKQFGIIYYPTNFISNNAGYALLNDLQYAKGISKLNATFIEPSFAGGYIAASFWALLFVNRLWAKIVSLLLFVALCFNLSGTGFATFIIGGVLCLLLFKKSYIILVLFASIFIYFFISYIGYGDYIMDILLNKSSTDSGIHRQGSNDASLRIFFETLGLGVGLGSHRASSFIYNMLATSGICSLFLIIYLIKLFKNIKSNIKSEVAELSSNYGIIFRFGLVYLISQFLAIPDLSNPTFWTWQFVAFLGIYDTKEHFKQSPL